MFNRQNEITLKPGTTNWEGQDENNILKIIILRLANYSVRHKNISDHTVNKIIRQMERDREYKTTARPNEYFKSLTLEELFYLKNEATDSFSNFIDEVIAERMADIRDEKINSILDGK